jgi:hypothetical protein
MVTCLTVTLFIMQAELIHPDSIEQSYINKNDVARRVTTSEYTVIVVSIECQYTVVSIE